MHVSIFYKCFTLVLLLCFTDFCVCSVAAEKQSIPEIDEAALVPPYLGQNLIQYQPEDEQEQEEENVNESDSDNTDDLDVAQLREVPEIRNQDLATIRKRFSLGEDIQAIVQENFQRELSRGSPATAVEPINSSPRRVVAVGKKIVSVADDYQPHLNYYYPSIGNKIVPTAVPYTRLKRHGESDLPGYEMKLNLQKREDSLEESSNAEKGEPVFHIKKVIQKPIAIDADSINIDEPVSMEWQDELEEGADMFDSRLRKRRTTQNLRDDLSDDANDEEGAANFIHYQIEKLKAKVKRDFEQSKKINKRSKLDEKHKVRNEKRDAEEAWLTLEVKRTRVPSSRTRRSEQAVAMDLPQFERLDSNDALGTNVENANNVNIARFENQAPLEPNEDQSLRAVSKEDSDKIDVEKAENDVDLPSDEELTNEQTIREPTILAHEEWDMSKYAPSSLVDRSKKKRNVESLVVDRSLLENDEFAPAIDYSFENAMKQRRRREVGEYVDDSNLKDNNTLIQPSYKLPTKRENAPPKNTSVKYDDLSKTIFPENSVDIQKVKFELDSLFRSINRSKANNIIPTNGEYVFEKFPKYKLPDQNEIGQGNTKTNYLKIENNRVPENRIESTVEKDQAINHSHESLDDDSSEQSDDVLKDSLASVKETLKAKAKSPSSGEVGDEEDEIEEDVDDLARQAKDIIYLRQMGQSALRHTAKHPVGRSYTASTGRRLLSVSETSIAENDHEGKSKRSAETGFDNQLISNGIDELQEDKSKQKSHTIKESDVSNVDASLKSDIDRRDTLLNNFAKNKDTDASASGSEEQWLEKQSRYISYGSDNENDVALSSQQARNKGKRQVKAEENTKPAVQSHKAGIHNTQGAAISQQDVNSLSERKLIDSRTADKFKAVDEELDEHNQRAIELRNMDVKVGPQVAEVAKLIEQSHQKEINKDRTQISGDNTLASLTHNDNEHNVRKKAENDAISTALNEERTKRSSRHHSGNHSACHEKAKPLHGDSFADLTGDLDLDLKGYFNNDEKDSHRLASHEKVKIAYKPVVDWQAGDRERFAQLQARRKLSESSSEDSEIANTSSSSSNMDSLSSEISNDNYNDEVNLEELNEHKSSSAGKAKFSERSHLRSDAESPASLSDDSAPKRCHGHSAHNSPNDLAKRLKLFELLKISDSKLNPKTSTSDDVEVSDSQGASWLENLIKNQVDEQLQQKVNKMESESLLKGELDQTIGLKDKSDYNGNQDVSHIDVKKSTLEEVWRAPGVSAVGGKSGVGRLRYVIKKRDLGADVDRPMEQVYYGRQFRDNNFHKRKVPPYGLPSADLFNKWDVLGDVHGFSKSLFNNLQTQPDEGIVAGFDSEGNYISPIALDRVKRMRRRRRRRRRRRGAQLHEDEDEERARRRRRRRRRTFLFPKDDPVEEFFARRRGAAQGDDDENEGEVAAGPRIARLRERRGAAAGGAKRDDKGWPVEATRNAGHRLAHAPSLAAALLVLKLGLDAS